MKMGLEGGWFSSELFKTVIFVYLFAHCETRPSVFRTEKDKHDIHSVICGLQIRLNQWVNTGDNCPQEQCLPSLDNLISRDQILWGWDRINCWDDFVAFCDYNL